jgi:alpha-L-fucosidase
MHLYFFFSRSLRSHIVPDWYKSSKFGIFIHWGVYSVPSWAPVGKNYAEWYWWNYNQRNSETYRYHRTVYGPEHEYDDFIELWNPNQYDPNAWLDLIDQSGAKYFVFTSKHHDGIALFDTKVTDRSTVKLNPHRDFLDEFLKEAEDHFPHLKKGIYCKFYLLMRNRRIYKAIFLVSLPEWYHPSYADDSLHWYGPPKNAYTGREVPYTGSRLINDFVNELQVPQALEIIRNYKPDIMWCDIGGINNSTVWQEEFLNEARKQGRQVAINDRCGNSVSDFQTVEYRGLNHLPSR